MTNKAIAFVACFLPVLVNAAITGDKIFNQAQKHQHVLIEQHSHEPFEPRSLDIKPLSILPATHEDLQQNCYEIKQIILDQDNQLLSNYLIQSITEAGYKGQYNQQENNYYLTMPWPCLSSSAIEDLVTSAQNKLIADGWITARVLIPEQNIKDGQLIIKLLPGLLNRVITVKGNKKQFTIKNALPVASGDLLNLRDIEQGLENFRRLPTVSAKIDIAPAEKIGGSDLIIDWNQNKLPLNASITVDNAGTNETGNYLSSIYLSYDNPLKLNDILSLSYTRNLLPGSKQKDIQGNSDSGKTNNYNLNYSIPYGYLLFDLNYSQYYYNQIVAGQTKIYHYSGKSKQAQADVSIVLYRDQRSKITLTPALWVKRNFSFIDDTEINVQRRQTAGWQVGVRQLIYLPQGTLKNNITYIQGERWFGARAAPEEAFNEGTARMRLLNMGIDWNMPFKFKNRSFTWHSHLHGQYNLTKLTAVDRLSIGGRYTVRGFEKRGSLAAERGGYIQNTIAWHYRPNHQLYWGIDAGYVSGPSVQQLPGQFLAGAALGVRGIKRWHGEWNYDVYVGKAVSYPKGMKPKQATLGFSLGYRLLL